MKIFGEFGKVFAAAFTEHVHNHVTALHWAASVSNSLPSLVGALKAESMTLQKAVDVVRTHGLVWYEFPSCTDFVSVRTAFGLMMPSVTKQVVETHWGAIVVETQSTLNTRLVRTGP